MIDVHPRCCTVLLYTMYHTCFHRACPGGRRDDIMQQLNSITLMFDHCESIPCIIVLEQDRTLGSAHRTSVSYIWHHPATSNTIRELAPLLLVVIRSKTARSRECQRDRRPTSRLDRPRHTSTEKRHTTTKRNLSAIVLVPLQAVAYTNIISHLPQTH